MAPGRTLLVYADSCLFLANCSAAGEHVGRDLVANAVRFPLGAVYGGAAGCRVLMLFCWLYESRVSVCPAPGPCFCARSSVWRCSVATAAETCHNSTTESGFRDHSGRRVRAGWLSQALLG